MASTKATLAEATGHLSFPCSNAADVFPAVYQELRRLAGHYMRQERPGQSLQATALVHEAYMKLAGQGKVAVVTRPEFFAIVGRVMREILVDHARARMAARRGGGAAKVPLNDSAHLAMEDPAVMLDIDVALCKLETVRPYTVRVVELRYFAGLSVEETAEALRLSPRTVKRHWSFARSFLGTQIGGE